MSTSNALTLQQQWLQSMLYTEDGLQVGTYDEQNTTNKKCLNVRQKLGTRNVLQNVQNLHNWHCFHVYAQKSSVNGFFDVITRSPDIRVHRAGSQLKFFHIP